MLTPNVDGVLDHLSIQATDVEAAADFYLRTFAPLGMGEALRYQRGDGTVVGLSGPDGFPRFWLGPRVDPGRVEVHVAFTASTREEVERVHEIAVAAGTEILHPPRLWPEYHDRYFGVFLRDLDGNNVEAVCHT